jgi:hypothetical protein
VDDFTITAVVLQESARLIAALLRDIRDEVIGLLFNRHVFRTHQEIVRQNPQLQGHPHSVFSQWAQVVYSKANAMGVRCLAGGNPAESDVSLIRLLNLLIRDSGPLWSAFEHHFEADATRVRAKIFAEDGQLATGWEVSACKRLLGEDRKVLVGTAEKANQFASKRVAHLAPGAEVTTTFSDLDKAINALKKITEKYTLLVSAMGRERLERIHQSGAPTAYPVFARLEEHNPDLLEEMKTRKLPKGWDSIFLKAWATSETLALPVGEMAPPGSET